jgi:hypothetical protein
MELDRRRFIRGAALAAAAAGSVGALTGCAPKPTIASARHTLRGLWDAAVPGTWNGVVQDWLEPGVPAPGADDARVQDWLELVVTSVLPPPLDFLGDGFFRAWAADLDLWADTFHPPFEGLPTFGHLPLGPSLAERGRQYKVMLMQSLFDGPLDLKYFAGITLAKVGFYADAHHELTGEGEPVGSRYIGFPGPNAESPPAEFSYRAPYGFADDRLITVGDGLVAAP